MGKYNLSYALRGTDIEDVFDDNIKIVVYSDLPKYKSLDELLNPYGRVIILYETNGIDNGHYTCLFRNYQGINYFDPYGMEIEQPLDYFGDGVKELTNSDDNYLNKLLYQDKYHIFYNQHRLQELRKGISTCGRWCIVRLLYPDIDEDEFYKIFKDASKESGISKDQIVTNITNKLL